MAPAVASNDSESPTEALWWRRLRPGHTVAEAPPAPVRADGTGDRRVLFTADVNFFFDLSPDWPTPDRRFVQIEDVKPAEGEEAPDVNGIVIVENWAE